MNYLNLIKQKMNFKGLGVALVTPFLRNGEIDYNFYQIIENIISGGANYLVYLEQQQKLFV